MSSGERLSGCLPTWNSARWGWGAPRGTHKPPEGPMSTRNDSQGRGCVGGGGLEEQAWQSGRWLTWTGGALSLWRVELPPVPRRTLRPQPCPSSLWSSLAGPARLSRLQQQWQLSAQPSCQHYRLPGRWHSHSDEALSLPTGTVFMTTVVPGKKTSSCTSHHVPLLVCDQLTSPPLPGSLPGLLNHPITSGQSSLRRIPQKATWPLQGPLHQFHAFAPSTSQALGRCWLNGESTPRLSDAPSVLLTPTG